MDGGLPRVTATSAFSALRRGPGKDCPESCAGAGFAQLTRNRSPKVTANCVRASTQSRGGRFQSAAARFSTRYSSFVAASSEGEGPRARTARRSFEFRAFVAFVVQTTRRTASGRAKNGMTRSQFRRQAGATAGCFSPQGPVPKASSAASPALASAARQMARSSGMTALRSFQEMKSREWRTRWTMQSLPPAPTGGLDDGVGEDGLDGPGGAFSPQVDGDQDVADAAGLELVHHPRARNSAPSVCRVHSPRTSRVPSGWMPSAMWTALAIGWGSNVPARSRGPDRAGSPAAPSRPPSAPSSARSRRFPVGGCRRDDGLDALALQMCVQLGVQNALRERLLQIVQQPAALGVSSGTEAGPWIGVGNRDPLRASGFSRSPDRPGAGGAGAIRAASARARLGQARFLKRRLSLPASTISQ